MIALYFAFGLSFPSALVADAVALASTDDRRPSLRRLPGLWLTWLLTAATFGVALSVSGQPWVALVFVAALHLILTFGSNAKLRHLGEPLLFSDFALIATMFRHPRFYFSVLKVWQKVLGVLSLIAVCSIIALLFEPTRAMALAGVIITFAALLLLVASFQLPTFQRLAPWPDAHRDVKALGLVPVLWLYWLRWRAVRVGERSSRTSPTTTSSNNAEETSDPDQIIVVVQCESFADPVELFGPSSTSLPSLERARRTGVQWGKLLVSGFGAYTMRTEYGVIYGVGEDELGFRLFDPYLTSLETPACPLPQRLGTKCWESLFLHPHDMRFYARDRILPKAGFAQLVGESAFAAPDTGEGRYVTDRAVADKILDLAASAQSNSLLYAVTMENHGPWAENGIASRESMVAEYTNKVRASDAMLGQLIEGLAGLGKPATLVFFGDHRPSIPGASMPGGDRHTPYVILRFDPAKTGRTNPTPPVDLTPAQLHDAIVAWGSGERSLQ